MKNSINDIYRYKGLNYNEMEDITEKLDD